MSALGQASSRAVLKVPLAALEKQPGWERRPCRGADPEGFFQKEGEHWRVARERLTATAEFYCRGCPFRPVCREVGSGDIWGMWGGVVWNRDQRSKKGVVVDLLAPERERAG